MDGSVTPMKVVGFAGESGAGKTGLVEKLIGQLKARGLRVSVVKHAHHSLDVDQPGKDSWRHREAGAVREPAREALGETLVDVLHDDDRGREVLRKLLQDGSQRGRPSRGGPDGHHRRKRREREGG